MGADAGAAAAGGAGAGGAGDTALNTSAMAGCAYMDTAASLAHDATATYAVQLLAARAHPRCYVLMQQTRPWKLAPTLSQEVQVLAQAQVLVLQRSGREMPVGYCVTMFLLMTLSLPTNRAVASSSSPILIPCLLHRRTEHCRRASRTY